MADSESTVNQNAGAEGFYAALRWLLAQLWVWPVTGVGAPLLYGFGISALYGDQYFLACLLFLAGIAWIAAKISSEAEVRQHSNRLYIQSIIAVASVLVFVLSVIWIYSRIKATKDSGRVKAESKPVVIAPQLSEKPLARTGVTTSIAIKEFFDKTPDGNIRIAPSNPFTYTRKGRPSTVLGAVLVDGQAQTYTLSFFIPASADTAEICKDLAKKIANPYDTLTDLLKAYDRGDYFEHPTPETWLAIKHPKFSGKVFVYHESIIPLYQRSVIDKMFQGHRMEVEFRGPDYAQVQMYYTSVKSQIN